MSKNFLNEILIRFQESNKLKAFKELGEYCRQNSEDLIALYNLGIMNEKLDQQDNAVIIYENIISKDKKNWKAKYNLHLIYFKKKFYKDSLILINKIIDINPEFKIAVRDKAHIFFHLGKFTDAHNTINNYLNNIQNDHLAFNIHGIISMKINDFSMAKISFLKSIEIKPNYISAINNLSSCYRNLNEPIKAINCIKSALKIKPNFIEGLINLGGYLIETGQFSKGIKTLKIALKKDNSAELNLNLAIGYFFIEKFKEAEKYFKITQKINPEIEGFKKNYSSYLLYKQNYKKAWITYDQNLDQIKHIHPVVYLDIFKEKLSLPNNLSKDNKILIINEQGVGDEIIYSSMYEEILILFPKTLIECDTRLISIFKRSFKSKNNFIPYKEISNSKHKIKNIDKVILSSNLPSALRNSINDFPNKKFLMPNKSNLDFVKKILDKKNDKIKIGFSWLSKRKYFGDAKSIELKSLLPILQLSKFSFVNLQYNSNKKEIEKFSNKEKINIINISEIDLFNDFEKTAALLCNIDLFVTISSTTAHLAGALGVPTFLIKPKNNASFHYWFQPSNSTPWYPSVKLFSQNNGIEKTIKVIKTDIEKKFKN